MKAVTSWTPPLSALLLAMMVAGACDEHAAEGDGAEDYFYTCDDAPAGTAVFATDESYRAIADKESAGEIENKDAEAARLMSPASGATLSAGTPPTFVIASPMALLAPSGPAGLPPRSVRRSLWRRALGSLAPIGTAHAHCPGVTGDNFLLRLTRAGDSKPVYSALVSVTSFTPRAESWSRAMKGRAGQMLSVTLIRAGFSGGRVTTGPFVGTQVVSLTVGS